MQKLCVEKRDKIFNRENKHGFAEFLSHNVRGIPQSHVSLQLQMRMIIYFAEIFIKPPEKPEFAQKMCASFYRSKILIVSAKNSAIFRRNSLSQSFNCALFANSDCLLFSNSAWWKCGRTGTRSALLFLPIFGPSSSP